MDAPRVRRGRLRSGCREPPRSHRGLGAVTGGDGTAEECALQAQQSAVVDVSDMQHNPYVVSGAGIEGGTLTVRVLPSCDAKLGREHVELHGRAGGIMWPLCGSSYISWVLVGPNYKHRSGASRRPSPALWSCLCIFFNIFMVFATCQVTMLVL